MCAIAERCGKHGTGSCKDLKILDSAKQSLAHDGRINTLSRTFPCYQLSRTLWIIAAARLEWWKCQRCANDTGTTFGVRDKTFTSLGIIYRTFKMDYLYLYFLFSSFWYYPTFTASYVSLLPIDDQHMFGPSLTNLQGNFFALPKAFWSQCSPSRQPYVSS